jgi:hypothetical protein
LRPAQAVGETRGKPAATPVATAAQRPRRRWLAVVGDLFRFLLLALGSIAFVALVCAGAYAAWDKWGRDLWTARFGAPPV